MKIIKNNKKEDKILCEMTQRELEFYQKAHNFFKEQRNNL